MELVIAHDYLVQMGGAERVVAVMHRRYPSAPIYTSAVNRRTLSAVFQKADIRTTWLQAAPGIQHHTHFKKYWALYPAAFKGFGPIKAERAWISSSAFAKYMEFTPCTYSVGYLHNTTRFLWQTSDYLTQEVSNGSIRKLISCSIPYLRRLDRLAARRLSVLVSNSHAVRKRIYQHYGRESVVVHPPVDMGRFKVAPGNDGFYLIVSRLVGYKNIQAAVKVCSETRRRLVIIGEGPYRQELEKMAGPTVQFLGRLSDEETLGYFQRCSAFLFPGNEDFGISPVEAMACGKPVVALEEGGALETVIDGKSGVFFRDRAGSDLDAALRRLEGSRWDSEAIRESAERFSERAFLDKVEAILFQEPVANKPREVTIA